MEDSGSWDRCSIASLSSSSSDPSNPVRSRVPSASTRSLVASGDLPVRAEASPAPTYSATPSIHPLAPSRESLPTSSDHLNGNIPPLPPTPPEPSPALSQHSHHPLASYLLAEHSLDISPPSSPAFSVSSFPHSRSRVPSSGALSSTRGRTGRGRGRTGSASSTVSTDGSAHEGSGGGKDSLASGASSAGDSENDHRGLVMPSLHLGGASMPLSAGRDEHSSKQGKGKRGGSPNRVKVLVLGKTADERKTLATLLSLDEDFRQATGANSVTDMSYSFLSTQRSESSSSSGPSQPPPPSPTLGNGTFEALPTAGDASSASVELYHPSSTLEQDPSRTPKELLRQLEQLETRLSRGYPTTDGLLSLVERAGCGDFDAAFFLFSSPPTAAEIATSRPLSHLIPLFPILILPPSPTGKPQKTAVLEQAVKEQLTTAGVRWIGAFSTASDRAKGRGNGLYLLPHDLFSHHPPSSSLQGCSGPSSVGNGSPNSTEASSPASEDAPHHSTSASSPVGLASLASSQELQPPPSPALTACSSSAGYRSSSLTSSRSPSTSSRSSSHHRRPQSRRGTREGHLGQQYSNSLASLYALQALVHLSNAPKQLRRERARQFAEWREVEIAASGGEGCLEEGLKARLEEWGEVEVDLAAVEGGMGRREVDFSRRVAERRKALYPVRASLAVEDDSDDVLASSSDEDDDNDPSSDSDEDGKVGLRARRGRGSLRRGEEQYTDHSTARNSFSSISNSMDPTTPRLSCRPLLQGLSSLSLTNSGAHPPLDPEIGYFPPSPPTVASPSSSPPSSGRSTPTASLTASSIFLLPSSSTDPFHLPSLLHLVGLNLRLALFAPAVAVVSASPPSTTRKTASESSPSLYSRSRSRHEHRESTKAGWGGWVRAAAVLGLVFAAGVAVGQVADGGSGGTEGRWALDSLFARSV